MFLGWGFAPTDNTRRHRQPIWGCQISVSIWDSRSTWGRSCQGAQTTRESSSGNQCDHLEVTSTAQWPSCWILHKVGIISRRNKQVVRPVMDQIILMEKSVQLCHGEPQTQCVNLATWTDPHASGQSLNKIFCIQMAKVAKVTGIKYMHWRLNIKRSK